jgi:hypothetical protein
MAFWNDAKSEPRRAHRFLLNLPLLGVARGGTAYKQYLAKTVTKPAYTVGETEHKFLGNTYYYPGALTWDACTVQLVNAEDPDGNELLYTALYESGYLDPTQQSDIFTGVDVSNQGSSHAGPGTPNKLDSLNALGDVRIRELNGSGKLIGTWELKNPWITSVKFGDLDYSTEDLLNIDITFRYDWAWYGPGSVEPGPVDVTKKLADENAEPSGQ